MQRQLGWDPRLQLGLEPCELLLRRQPGVTGVADAAGGVNIGAIVAALVRTRASKFDSQRDCDRRIRIEITRVVLIPVHHHLSCFALCIRSQ